MFRKGDIKNALPIIDSLINGAAGESLFLGAQGPGPAEDGTPAKAAGAACRRRSKLLPNNGLIQILMAQALIATENQANARQALNLLTLAKRTEGEIG